MGREHVGGVSVEVVAFAVVAEGGAGVSVAGGVLDVLCEAEFDHGVSRSGGRGVRSGHDRVRSGPSHDRPACAAGAAPARASGRLPAGVNGPGASTVSAYNAANNALTSVTEPKESSGDTAGTDSYQYNTLSGGAGSSYLPSSDTDAQGSYTPCGDTTQTTGTSTTPWRWTGSYYYTEGDHYYHQGARHNDTRGHFTQPDSIIGSIAKPDTVDAYAYAGGDPINNTDPTGRSGNPADLVGAGVLLETESNTTEGFFGGIAEAGAEGAEVVAAGGPAGVAVGLLRRHFLSGLDSSCTIFAHYST